MSAHTLRRILLINPNSSVATTQMMLKIGLSELDKTSELVGVTARRSPSMILTPAELMKAGEEVVEIADMNAGNYTGIIVSAFGDPGLDIIRKTCRLPSTGLCEASMLEAASGVRRFGVATVTPDLIPIIDQRAEMLGLGALYTGVRCTTGNPKLLTADSVRLNDMLAEAIEKCLHDDKAEAVIVGGGPLGQAAIRLQQAFNRPIIAPIPAAIRQILKQTPSKQPAIQHL